MYLDPSFGGMLLQIIVVIAAVGGALVYSLRRKIRALFTKNKETNIDAENIRPSETSTETREDSSVIDMLSDDGNGGSERKG